MRDADSTRRRTEIALTGCNDPDSIGTGEKRRRGERDVSRVVVDRPTASSAAPATVAVLPAGALATPRNRRDLNRLAAAFERGGSFVDEFADDIAHRFLAADHANRLAGHDAARLDIAVDDRALERTGPIMFDLQL